MYAWFSILPQEATRIGFAATVPILKALSLTVVAMLRRGL
jgi:hypothetical protein